MLYAYEYRLQSFHTYTTHTRVPHTQPYVTVTSGAS